MKDYLNKKVVVYEKLYGVASSTDLPVKRNRLNGILTNIYDDRFIELDNKILIAIDYIYKIEIVD